ncbi:hypothetical protein CHUAL_005120 [Chamberlinius hualienensis]
MLLYFMLCITILMTAESLADITPCNKLPKPFISTELLISNNPYTTFWSSWPIFECTEVAYVPPQPYQTDFNLTGIITSVPTAFSFRLLLIDNNLWDATLCTTGMRKNYTTAYSNFTDPSNAFCVVNCGADGASYGALICIGKTPNDKKELEQFWKQHGIPGVQDMQQNCDNNFCPDEDNKKKSDLYDLHPPPLSTPRPLCRDPDLYWTI